MIRIVAAVVVAIGLFLWGIQVGADRVQAKWDRDKMAQAQLVQQQQKDNLARDQRYESQLRANADQIDLDRRELARLRSTAQPGKLRCTAVTTRTGGVPAVPPAPSGSIPASGALSGNNDASFDPAPAALAVADEADDFVLTCKSALAQWPK